MARFNFVCPESFEPWDYRNYDNVGIGGSETAVCELAWRLAARGHEVKVYGPLAEGCEPQWRGTTWLPLQSFDVAEGAIWVISRRPEYAVLGFTGQVWVQCQDVDYPTQWSPEAVANIGRVMALCETHGRYLRAKYPAMAEKVCVSSNGARTELFDEVEQPERDPNRVIWASSPDRGLVDYLLPAWPAIREAAPTAELHVYYGWDNMDKIIAELGPDCASARIKADAERAFAELGGMGVYWHGRTPQRELYQEWLRAGVWAQFSDFEETSCVNSMEAQCGGAIPVTRPYWAVGENVRHGCMVDAQMASPMGLAEAASYVAGLVNDPDAQEAIRAAMIPEARFRCSWEHVADQWEWWALGIDCPSPQSLVWPRPHYLQFQECNADEKTLVVGAGGDVAGLQAKGAFCTDVCATDPVSGSANHIDAVMDARDLKFPDNAFERVIIGEVIEHLSRDGAERAVAEAMRVGKKVVATIPDDPRTIEEQRREREVIDGCDPTALIYADGCSTYHRRVCKAEVAELFRGASYVCAYPLQSGHGYPCWGVIAECS